MPPPLTQMCSWDPLTFRVNSVLNVKALVGTFNQEKALEGAFSVIVKRLAGVCRLQGSSVQILVPAAARSGCWAAAGRANRLQAET